MIGMRFKIGDKLYTHATLGQPELGDYLRLENETAALGRRISAIDAEEMSKAVAACKTEAEKRSHPDTLTLIALNVWAAMCHAANEARDAGRPVTRASWEDAIAVSLDDLTFLEDPQDHQAAAGPRKPRTAQGSVRGAKHPPGKRATAAKKASRRKSTSGS